MKSLVSALLVVAGVIHLLPVTGVAGGERLAALYGTPIGSPDLEILLRHRAVLFGLLGALLVYAAFNTALQPLAIAAGAISTVSFLVIAVGSSYNHAIARVVMADIVAVACLAICAGVLTLPKAFR